jgi:hypothetical protein
MIAMRRACFLLIVALVGVIVAVDGSFSLGAWAEALQP